MRLLAIVLALAVLLPSGDAKALVVCKARSGKVLVRDACRRKETRVSLPEFGVPGAPGATGTAGAPGRAALYLVDATGVEIGPVVYAAEFVGFLSSGDPHVHALIRGDQIGGAALIAAALQGGVVGTVSYTSTDCSGGPLVDGNNLMPVLQVIVDTAFRPVQPAGAAMLQSSETTDQSLGCTSVTPRGGCCRSHPATPNNMLWTASTTTLTALGVHPPFHVSGR
jgi:hypothetical protein